MEKLCTILTGPLCCVLPLKSLKLQAMPGWLLVVFFLPLFSGCNYYRISKEQPVSEAKLRGMPNYKRYLLYLGNDIWELRDLQVKEQVLEGTLHPVPYELMTFVDPSITSLNRYHSRNKMIMQNLLHLHIYEYAKGENNKVIIPFSAVKVLYAADTDKFATISSHVLVPFGSAMFLYGLWIALLLLTWGGH